MSHQDDADALNEALMSIADAIPGLADLSKRAIAGLIRYASVPDACIHQTLALGSGVPGIPEAAKLDADRAKEDAGTEEGVAFPTRYLREKTEFASLQPVIGRDN